MPRSVEEGCSAMEGGKSGGRGLWKPVVLLCAVLSAMAAGRYFGVGEQLTALNYFYLVVSDVGSNGHVTVMLIRSH